MLDPAQRTWFAAVQEIKAAAKQDNQQGTRILAQQLVRLRGQITASCVSGGRWGREGC